MGCTAKTAPGLSRAKRLAGTSARSRKVPGCGAGIRADGTRSRSYGAAGEGPDAGAHPRRVVPVKRDRGNACAAHLPEGGRAQQAGAAGCDRIGGRAACSIDGRHSSEFAGDGHLHAGARASFARQGLRPVACGRVGEFLQYLVCCRVNSAGSSRVVHMTRYNNFGKY